MQSFLMTWADMNQDHVQVIERRKLFPDETSKFYGETV